MHKGKREKSKKICFYTVSHPMFGLGGAEIQTYFYAKEFARQGWDVFFLTAIKKEKKSEFDNTGIKLVFFSESKFFFITWLKIIFKLIFINADLYYYRHHKYSIGLIAIICKIFGKKYVWSVIHNDYCRKNASINTLIESYKKYKSLLKILAKCKLKFEYVLFNFGVNNADLIIAQNKIQKRTIKQEFSKKSIIIYNSHPLPKEDTSKKKNQIIFVSTMRFFKQPEIFAQVAGKLRNSSLMFLAVGENYGEKDKAERLKELFCQNNVKYIGACPLEMVNRLIGESKVLVNTSLNEGFPNTFIQAWLRGVPVVSLNVDPDNLIKTKKLGFFSGGDIDKLTEEIVLLIQDQKLWKKLSDNCKNFAVKHFDISKTVTKLSEIFTVTMSA